MSESITVNVADLYAFTGIAKPADLPKYEQAAIEMAGNGNVVTLTGPGPIWLYLRIAHALHGKAMTLNYESPVSGVIEIFNHNPF